MMSARGFSTGWIWTSFLICNHLPFTASKQLMSTIHTRTEDLPFAALNHGNKTSLTGAHRPETGLGSNDPCPISQSEKMDYNGMLNLECIECGYTLGGCFA